MQNKVRGLMKGTIPDLPSEKGLPVTVASGSLVKKGQSFLLRGGGKGQSVLE